MSFRCFKSKSVIYATINDDHRDKSKPNEHSEFYNEKRIDDVRPNWLGFDNDNPNPLCRSYSDLSLFRLADHSVRGSVTIEDHFRSPTNSNYNNHPNIMSLMTSNYSRQSTDNRSPFTSEANYSFENLIDSWSKCSNVSGKVTESQKFISNLMSKKEFDVVKEPLRSLPRDMSVKYVKEPPNFIMSNIETMSKDRNHQPNVYNRKSHAFAKTLPPDKSLNDSIGTFPSGPLTIVRNLENRNSGGSSSVATPNSPQQSPLSLCSSSGGNPSEDQFYEDGLSEEELRQIALRQQRQIQLQLDELRNKQHQINLMKQQVESTSKIKVAAPVLKLKELYEQQQLKLRSLKNFKAQVIQTKTNLSALKADITEFQNILECKKTELKKIEMNNDEFKEFLRHRNSSSSQMPPEFESFIRQKNSIIPVNYPDQSSQLVHSVRCTEPSVNYFSVPVSTYPDSNRLYIRQTQIQNDNFSSNIPIYTNASSDSSAFLPLNSNFKPSETQGINRPPPLPAHSYQRISNQATDKNQQTFSDHFQQKQTQKIQRPPLPSYSDATLISAKYAMLLQARHNMRTPTSSPPVLRRASIVGLPSGKMPSRFASRNTINNVYIKKSSMETLEKYKKTASEMYKAQLSKFKSSSSDDIRLDNSSTVGVSVNNSQEPPLASPDDITSLDLPEPPTEVVDLLKSKTDAFQENISVCSSCSSLSLPEDLIDVQKTTVDITPPLQTDNDAVNNQSVEIPIETGGLDDLQVSIDTEEVSDDLTEIDDCLWEKSVKRALEALNKDPTKRILKKSPPAQTSVKRKAHFDPHSLLLDAALEAEFDLVKEMATKVDDISKATDEGITALHNAVCSGREDIVKFLLDLGAHVNAGDTDGWTPLHCAASCNNASMAKLLVEYGASLFATSISDSEIPLQKCEVDEDTECEQYLFAQQDILGIANDGKVYSLFQYEPQNDDELFLYPNQELKIIDKEPAGEPGWFLASDFASAKCEGFVPKAYVSCYPLTLPKKPVEAESK